jgi:phage repressor protein C with HTH and peptisase S24 domain
MSAERAVLHLVRLKERFDVSEKCVMRMHSNAGYAGFPPQRQVGYFPNAPLSGLRDNVQVDYDLVKLTDRIAERLQAVGLSERKVAMMATGKPDAIRDIRRGSQPSATRLQALADALGTTTEYLLGATDIVTPAPPGERIIPAILEMKKDIPVYGTAIGADIEFMSSLDHAVAVEQTDLNRAEVIDRFRRPLGLRERQDLYGLYVAGTSMEPAFESGRGILVDPKRPPAIRDYVVVYIARQRGDHPDMEGIASILLKRLVRRSGAFIELEQFNPPAVFQVPLEDVAAVHRIMPWDEAFGL